MVMLLMVPTFDDHFQVSMSMSVSIVPVHVCIQYPSSAFSFAHLFSKSAVAIGFGRRARKMYCGSIWPTVTHQGEKPGHPGQGIVGVKTRSM